MCRWSLDEKRNVTLNNTSHKIFRTSTTAIALILVAIFASCQRVYDEETSVICFTRDIEAFRLRVNFTMLVKNEDLNGEFEKTLDRFLIDFVKTQIRVFLLDYSSINDSLAFTNSIENGSLNQLLKRHINGLPRLERSKMKSAEIIILIPRGTTK